MRDNKFETQEEIYQALLDGRKITSHIFKTIKYFNLKNGNLVDDMNHISSLAFHSPCDWSIYENLEPKKQVWQWRFSMDGSGWIVSNILMSEWDACQYYKLGSYEKHAGPFEVDSGV